MVCHTKSFDRQAISLRDGPRLRLGALGALKSLSGAFRAVRVSGAGNALTGGHLSVPSRGAFELTLFFFLLARSIERLVGLIDIGDAIEFRRRSELICEAALGASSSLNCSLNAEGVQGANFAILKGRGANAIVVGTSRAVLVIDRALRAVGAGLANQALVETKNRVVSAGRAQSALNGASLVTVGAWGALRV